jgi:hypothetical protein
MALFQLTGSLRLGNGLGFGAPSPALADAAALGDDGGSPPYMESLVKLFPAEGVALVTFIPGIAAGNMVVKVILVLVLCGVIVLLRQQATRPAGGGSPDWIAVIIAVVSFVLYTMTIGIFGVFFDDPNRHALLMSFVSGVWIFVVPFFPKRS